MNANALRALKYTSKPARWNEVTATVPSALLEGQDPALKIYSAAELGIESFTLAQFKFRPAEGVFLVLRGAALFLVNTEGYNYARYIAKVQ